MEKNHFGSLVQMAIFSSHKSQIVLQIKMEKWVNDPDRQIKKLRNGRLAGESAVTWMYLNVQLLPLLSYVSQYSTSSKAITYVDTASSKIQQQN